MTNFSFLSEHDPLYLQLARAAEQVFAGDPNTTLIKLRQIGKALARIQAERAAQAPAKRGRKKANA